MNPRAKALGWDLPAWGFFFSISVVLGLISTIPLTGMVHIPTIPFLLAMSCAVLGMIFLALMTTVITGAEVYNFHHYFVMVVSAAALTLWLMGQPVLRGLDVVVVAVGVTYAIGRFACLRGGCCYGKPHAWGVCYPAEYLQHGFPPGLLGVKLFPSQIVESLCMLITTAVAVALLLRNAQPGSAFAWFIVLYSIGRFFSDFYRLEAGFCVRGLSEAQIAAIVMTSVVVGLEQLGLLPFHSLHAAAALLLVVIGLARVLSTSGDKLLFTSDHVVEIANAVKRAETRGMTVRREGTAEDGVDQGTKLVNDNGNGFKKGVSKLDVVNVERTSLGLLISAGQISTDGRSLAHYCISREGTLTDSTARSLAKLISHICGCPGEESLIKRAEVFHVVIGTKRQWVTRHGLN